MVAFHNNNNDDGCLCLKDDTDLEATTTASCLALLRTTVILSNTVWWMAAYAVSTNSSTSSLIHRQQYTTATTTTMNWKLFLLLTFHPALLYLDHVHFQYNGLLLGLIMLSLAFLMHANNFDNKNPHVSPTCRTETNQRASGGAYHLLAAACFGLVLTMKHLYITYSGWFVVYLARRFCCVKVQSSAPHPRLRVAWKRLVRLVQTVSLVMLAPFTVFVAALYKESRTQDTLLIVLLRDWLQQLYTRLFPFQRGLVHDYWAGNVWALYTALLQCGKFLVRQCAASAFCHQTTVAAAKLDHWLSSPHLAVTRPSLSWPRWWRNCRACAWRTGPRSSSPTHCCCNPSPTLLWCRFSFSSMHTKRQY